MLAACTSPNDDTAGGMPSNAPSASITSLASPTPAASPISVTLNAINRSGESGTATLQEMDGKVQVSINLTGKTTASPQPAHIHVGTCTNVGNIIYPLTDVVSGQSTTTLPVDMATLMAKGKTVINVHQSVKQINTHVACGTLPFATASMSPSPKGVSSSPQATGSPMDTSTPANPDTQY